MVVVAKMIGVADSRPVFDHFFSGFPESVLVVPYEDSKRRNSICKLLDLSSELDWMQCLFLDTDGSVLAHFLNDGKIMPYYGAEAFPFTREMVEDITAKQKQLRKNGTLEQLLRPYESSSPDDVSVYRFNDPGEVVNISQLLRNKHVALLMCTKGDVIPSLNKVYKKWKEKCLDFEIVVLYCPYLMPEIFKDEMDNLMQEEGVREWWCLPFNNSVTLRFSSLTKNYCNYTYRDSDDYDKVIIVGPSGEILDMYGAWIIRHEAVDAYPFTREAFVDMEMKKASEITLDSLLVDRVFRGNDRSDVISPDELIGKKRVVIYTASLRRLNATRLVSQYVEMMKTKEGSDPFEMVFFNTDTGKEVGGKKIKAMPWYVYPRDATHSASLIKLMEYEYQFYGFGVDGRICAFSDRICLGDTLREDVKRRYSFDEFEEI